MTPIDHIRININLAAKYRQYDGRIELKNQCLKPIMYSINNLVVFVSV